MSVPQGLECCDEVLKGCVQADEYVDGPCDVGVEDEIPGVRVSIMCIVLEVVLEEELKDDVDGEHVFVHVDAATNLFDLECKGLPRLYQSVGESLLVHLFDEIGPGVADVGNIAVVCGMINKQADIVIASLVGIIVIQLSKC